MFKMNVICEIQRGGFLYGLVQLNYPQPGAFRRKL
jgi:hypothetical protein